MDIHLFFFLDTTNITIAFHLKIGKTKVFLRAGQMAELDARRSEMLGRSASIIQRKVRSYLSRRSFIMVRQSAIQIQAACRGACYMLASLLVGSSICLGNQDCV